MPRRAIIAPAAKPWAWAAPYMPHEIDIHPEGKRITATIEACTAAARQEAAAEAERDYEDQSETIDELRDALRATRRALEDIAKLADQAPEYATDRGALTKIIEIAEQARLDSEEASRL